MGKDLILFELRVLNLKIRIIVIPTLQSCFIGNSGIWHIAVIQEKEATIYYFPTVIALLSEATRKTAVVQ